MISRITTLPPLPARDSIFSDELEPEQSTFYYRNSNGRPFLQVYPNGTTVTINKDDLRGVLEAEENAEALQNFSRFLYEIRYHHSIDYDGPLSGYAKGLHTIAGRNYYCTSAPVLITPKQGGWDTIKAFLSRLLFTDESRDIQIQTLLAHLKLSFLNLQQCLAATSDETRNVRPAQAMVLCGPVNCGKSFLFEHIITPLLGGRSVDAYSAFSAGTDGFNSELLYGEVLKIDDKAGSKKGDLRSVFSSNLKSLLFSGAVSIHGKYMTRMTLKPFGRLFIMCNDQDKDMATIPDLTPDIKDKLIVLRCKWSESVMPTNTGEERAAYLAQITSELPAFLQMLLHYEIPPAIQGQRTGVESYINPVLANRMEESAPEIVLIELIQGAFKAGLIHSGNEPWRGTAMELHGKLTAIECPNWRVAADRFGGARSMGIYLARLAEQSHHYATKYRIRINRAAPRRGYTTYTLLQLADEPELL